MSFIKQILPPLIWDWLYQSPFRKYGWFGNYRSWDEAKKNSKGYDADLILNKVKEASLKVKNGEFPYERDSKLFSEIQYDWPVLAGLLWVAAQENGKLDVIDFGGSLGSTYRQNRKFLNDLHVRWSIIEQPQFVDCGRHYLEDNTIKFYYDVPSCLQAGKANVILLSSVLSYVPEPYDLLESLLNHQVEYFILDRVPLIQETADRLTVQVVSPHVYEASYPAWFFSRAKFMQFINQKFYIIEEFDCRLKLNVPSEVKGFILRMKNLDE